MQVRTRVDCRYWPRSEARLAIDDRAQPSAESPLRIAHLVSHPIYYFAPLYRELTARPGVDLTVYFYSDASIGGHYERDFDRSVRWSVPLLEGYRSRICDSAHDRPLGSRLYLHRDIVREVIGGRYDAIWVHGYGHLTTWAVVLAARLRRIPVLLREEQTLLGARPWWKRLPRWLLLRALCSDVFGLYSGEESRRFLRYYGVPERRLFPVRYCVDNAALQREAAQWSGRQSEARARFGIADQIPVVLFVGKLTHGKQPLLLLEAFARVRRRHRCALLVVGDGPLFTELQRRVEAGAVPDVHLAGFLNQDEIGAAYAAADLLVLPSLLETWGLVVNEAMNFALPAIVSDHVGCGADLVQPGVTGDVVPRGDVTALADAIERLVADPAARAAAGAASRRRIDRYSIAACADGILAAGRAAWEHVRR